MGRKSSENVNGLDGIGSVPIDGLPAWQSRGSPDPPQQRRFVRITTLLSNHLKKATVLASGGLSNVASKPCLRASTTELRC